MLATTDWTFSLRQLGGVEVVETLADHSSDTCRRLALVVRSLSRARVSYCTTLGWHLVALTTGGPAVVGDRRDGWVTVNDIEDTHHEVVSEPPLQKTD